MRLGPVGVFLLSSMSSISQAKSGRPRLMKASLRCFFAPSSVSSICAVRSRRSRSACRQFFLGCGLGGLRRFSCERSFRRLTAEVTSSSLVTIATISSFMRRQARWKRVRISMLRVSSWTRAKTRWRTRSKTVQCLTRSAKRPQLRWSMASTRLSSSCSNRPISSSSRQPWKMVSLSRTNISSKFFSERMCGIVSALCVGCTCRRLRFSAERIFLVRVSVLFCPLRQCFFLLISPRLLLISRPMQSKSSCSRGESTFSEVRMKWSMMSLLRSMLYFERSSRFSSFSRLTDSGYRYFFSSPLIRCSTAASQILLNFRSRRASCVFQSLRLIAAMSANFSAPLGSIMLCSNLFSKWKEGIVSLRKMRGQRSSRMLHLRSRSSRELLPQVNCSSSSLQSLSNWQFSRFSPRSCTYSSSLRSLKSRPIVQESSTRVSLNREDTFGARSTTLMQVLPRKLQAAARQGPAVAVMPVFNPMNPSRRSSLLVFSHSTTRVPLGPFAAMRKERLATMRRKSRCFMQRQQRRATSAALERAHWLGRPCGLPNCVCLSPSARACRFISPTNAVCRARSSAPRSEPPQAASSLAASFPLGSISPYSSCSTVYSSPSLSSAEVPPIRVAASETLAVAVRRSTLCEAAMWSTVQKVIILVRLAIYPGSVARCETMVLSVGYSTTMKLSDLMDLSSGALLGRIACFRSWIFSVETGFGYFLGLGSSNRRSSLPSPSRPSRMLLQYFSLLSVQLQTRLLLVTRISEF